MNNKHIFNDTGKELYAVNRTQNTTADHVSAQNITIKVIEDQRLAQALM